MPEREPGLPGTPPDGEGEAYAKVVVHEVLPSQLHEEAGEDPHFEPERDCPARRRAIIEPHHAELVTDSHFGFDVTSPVSDSGALRMNERGPDLHLARSRDEGPKGLDARKPARLDLRGGRNRG